MRLEDYLSQKAVGRSQPPKRPAAVLGAPRDQEGRDSVTISAEAKAALGSGGSLAAAGPAENSARSAFSAYMDKVLGRGVIGAPKSLKEKMEELAAEIKKIRTRLAEVAADQSLPEAARGGLVKALSAQAEALEARMAELGKEAASAAEAK